MEEEIGQKAISRCCKGEKPLSIYTDLNRSQVWFFKWLKRYQSGKPEWFKDKSKAPTIRPCRNSEIDTQRIISVRQHLESQKSAQTGASAIKWELTKTGHSFPSDSTINRVLEREGFIKKNFICPQGVEYSYFTEALDSNNIHQADLVGPCCIKGDGKIQSFNLDVWSHQVSIELLLPKIDFFLDSI